MRVIRAIAVLPIRFYRKFVSPLFPPCCRFYPSCSAYAMTAVERFGVLKGGLLSVRRVLRCHPWARGGFDFVPEQLPEGKRFDFLRLRSTENVFTEDKE